MRKGMFRRVKIVPTANGADLIRGGATLSEVLRAPGPTHSVFDVIAAVVAAFTPAAAEVALLGFAGGGIVAPLRAMECDATIRGVDLDLSGVEVFERLCGSWCGEVSVEEAEAYAFLAPRRKWSAIVDDLSVLGPKGETKPAVSLERLPQRMRKRTRAGGFVLHNVLDVPGRPFSRMEAELASHWPCAVSIRVAQHVNRLVLAAEALPPAREINARLNLELARIGSGMQQGIAVRTL